MFFCASDVQGLSYKPFHRYVCRWCDVGCIGWYSSSWSSCAADLHVSPSWWSLDLSWLGLIFDGWGSRGQCCYSTEFLYRIFGPCYNPAILMFLLRTGLLLSFSVSSLGAGGFFAEVVLIFNLGESCMFPASPGAARERELVTRTVPSSAADVCHHC